MKYIEYICLIFARLLDTIELGLEMAGDGKVLFTMEVRLMNGPKEFLGVFCDVFLWEQDLACEH